jgi:hypothetical protein
VPKVASNYSTINDGYGAVAAVSEAQNDSRFAHIPDIQLSRSNVRFGAIKEGAIIPLAWADGRSR